MVALAQGQVLYEAGAGLGQLGIPVWSAGSGRCAHCGLGTSQWSMGQVLAL